jgi:outer membrane protein OmpA-like peptidoglycan-associated protein
MLRRVILSSAVALAIGGGFALPSAAQDAGEQYVTFGEGESRGCNPVITNRNDPVNASTPDRQVLYSSHTFDCPEAMVAEVAPAAPPPPLPESGLIYFDFDKANLNDEGQATMDAIIADIKDRQLGGITVDGFTDTAGPAEYNMQLSQRRANTVATELIKSGVPASLIAAEGFGQTNLAVETPDGVPNQANRRVTIDFSR